jgi:hypothetical protein
MSNFVTSVVLTKDDAPATSPAVPKIRPADALRRELTDVDQDRRKRRLDSFYAIGGNAIPHITANLNKTLDAAIERAKRERKQISSATFYLFGFAKKGEENDERGNRVYFRNPSMGSEVEVEAGTGTGTITGLYLLDLVKPDGHWHEQFFKMLDKHINEMAGGGDGYWTGHRWNTFHKCYELFVSWAPRPQGFKKPTAAAAASTRPPKGPRTNPGPLPKRLPEEAEAGAAAAAGGSVDSASFPLLASLMAGPEVSCDPKIAQTPRTVGPNASTVTAPYPSASRGGPRPATAKGGARKPPSPTKVKTATEAAASVKNDA